MKIEILKSKIHRATVTGADLNYIGSITIDEALMNAANIKTGEKVHVVNINNGERLITYVINGKKNSGEITLNGPAARKVQKGDEGEGWDGVRNHQAANNMKAMEIGELGFFYHSVSEKRIVGIVEVIQTYHPDPTDASGRFGMVTVRAVKPMVRPVTLAEVKAEESLSQLALVRQSRLSVVPVTSGEWAQLLTMGETRL